MSVKREERERGRENLDWARKTDRQTEILARDRVLVKRED